jgi:hypothetical protein
MSDWCVYRSRHAADRLKADRRMDRGGLDGESENKKFPFRSGRRISCGCKTFAARVRLTSLRVDD